MPLKVVSGDLLNSDCSVMAHQANCFSVMGAGIAKQLADKWPAVYRADHQYYRNAPADKLGKCSHALVEGNKIMVYNLYGQYNFGRGKQQTSYEALERALRMMLDELKQLGNQFYQLKIGVPFGIGCGLAGGNWDVVSKLLETTADEYGITIYAYKL